MSRHAPRGKFRLQHEGMSDEAIMNLKRDLDAIQRRRVVRRVIQDDNTKDGKRRVVIADD
jgi:hypothetical protein